MIQLTKKFIEYAAICGKFHCTCIMEFKEDTSFTVSKKVSVEKIHQFNEIWILFKKYDKFFGTLGFEVAVLRWKFFRFFSILNFVIFYIETAYCAILHSDQASECLVYISFWFLLTFGFGYKLFLLIHGTKMLEFLEWCEYCHKIQSKDAKEIFGDMLPSVITRLKARLEISIYTTSLLFIVGGLLNSFSEGHFVPIFPMHLPIFEEYKATVGSFIFYTVHHLWGVMFLLIDAVLTGGLGSIVHQHIYGQLLLLQKKINYFGENIRNGHLDLTILKIVVDLNNELKE